MIIALFVISVFIQLSFGGNCICSLYCSEENTVGFEYNGRCYYMRHKIDLADYRSSPVTEFRNETVLHLFQIAAGEFRDKFNVSVVSVHFKKMQRLGVLGKHFYLPSYDLNLVRSAAIDLQSKIIFDEYPYVGVLTSYSKFYHTNRFFRLT